MKFVDKAMELIQQLRNKTTEIDSDLPIESRLSTDTATTISELISDRPEPFVQPTLEDLLAHKLPITSSWATAICFSDALYEFTNSLVSASDEPLVKDLKVSEPRKISEPKFPAANPPRSSKQQLYYRWRVTSLENSVSVRASDTAVEIFLIKTDDIPLLAFSEFGSRLKAKFDLVRTASGYEWQSNKSTVTYEVVTRITRECIAELADNDTESGAQFQPFDVTSLDQNDSESLQRLQLEKQNLIFKVLNQQEVIKNELARSLHDTVLADLLMLKRHMRGDQELSRDEIIETVDEIAQQLRDICNECAPRNLHDWGLKTSLQDLLLRMEQRTAISCELHCEIEIPNLPDTVELHIFRLVQECLNNIEKHARAKKVEIVIECPRFKNYKFVIKDDGKGFVVGDKKSKDTDSGGMGVSGMAERCDLIRCFFPTEFSVWSEPGKGTMVSLEITVP